MRSEGGLGSEETKVERRMASGEGRVEGGRVSGEARVESGRVSDESGRVSDEARVESGRVSGEARVESGRVSEEATNKGEPGSSREDEPLTKRLRLSDISAMADEPIQSWLDHLPRDDIHHVALLLYTRLPAIFGIQKTNVVERFYTRMKKQSGRECTGAQCVVIWASVNIITKRWVSEEAIRTGSYTALCLIASSGVSASDFASVFLSCRLNHAVYTHLCASTVICVSSCGVL